MMLIFNCTCQNLYLKCIYILIQSNYKLTSILKYNLVDQQFVSIRLLYLHRFIGEESTADGAKIELTDSPTWIIDPIDGTMNFVHGYPNVCISVGLLVNKVTEIGVIYNPVLEQLFTARRGQGALYNDKPIKVSDKKGKLSSYIQQNKQLTNFTNSILYQPQLTVRVIIKSAIVQEFK